MVGLAGLQLVLHTQSSAIRLRLESPVDGRSFEAGVGPEAVSRGDGLVGPTAQAQG
jgi:hypothetical protein